MYKKSPSLPRRATILGFMSLHKPLPGKDLGGKAPSKFENPTDSCHILFTAHFDSQTVSAQELDVTKVLYRGTSLW